MKQKWIGDLFVGFSVCRVLKFKINLLEKEKSIMHYEYNDYQLCKDGLKIEKKIENSSNMFEKMIFNLICFKWFNMLKNYDFFNLKYFK